MEDNNYEKVKAEIEAIPKESVLTPSMPVDKFAQECDNLVTIAMQDKEKLQAKGMDVSLIDEITPRSKALRYIEAQWIKEYRDRRNVAKEWSENSEKAFDLRDTIQHDFLFAYRNIPDLKSKVDIIAEGAGNADMIQDLMNYSVFGKNFPEPLNAINFDMSILDEAQELSIHSAQLLSKANGARDDINEMKVLRDKAYTHLKEVVDKVRDYGKYVFWRDPDRLIKYTSDYRRKKS